jgi:hypothetical protein
MKLTVERLRNTVIGTKEFVSFRILLNITHVIVNDKEVKMLMKNT